jgi:hypothetical protein
MSTATEIARLQAARNMIRNKLVNLGLAESTDLLDDLATEIDGIANNGAVSAQVQEGDTYTIPAGWHNGSGTVSGVAGGGNYTLQSKGPITPTKTAQSIAPDSGYYGLSAVSIAAIPEAYQDVSSVTATAGDVLSPKIIVTSDGTAVPGTMTNNGAVSKKLDATEGNQTYTVPKGYHSGAGSVAITLEEKSATPTKASQDITPTSGKVLSKVTVAAIPSAYQDVSNVDAAAADVLDGKIIVAADGTEVEGTMPNVGSVSKTLDATTGNQTYTVPAGKHSGSGTVKIVLETKTATPSTSAQNITPTAGKVLSKVTVNAIPAQYGDTTGDTGTAADVLAGVKVHTIVNGTATLITGSMADNGAISGSIDGLTATSYTIPAGRTTGGSVTLTSDIEDALAAI